MSEELYSLIYLIDIGFGVLFKTSIVLLICIYLRRCNEKRCNKKSK